MSALYTCEFENEYRMPIPPDHVRVQALSFGPEVEAVLCAGMTDVRVLAVLSDALYLSCPQGRIICMLSEQAGDGPLTVRVDKAGLRAVLRALPKQVEIDLRNARRWTPCLPAVLGRLEARFEAADALVSMVSANSDHDHGRTRDGVRGMDGFGPLAPILWDMYHEGPCRAPKGTRLQALHHADLSLHRAAHHLTRFYEAFVGDEQSKAAAQALVDLLGLGPGLTPSGDDVVMGLMAALVWQAKSGVLPTGRVEALAEAVCLAASKRTNRISARLLRHASDGVLHAPAMAVGTALVAGNHDAVRQTTPRLLAVGSTSGADLAVGLLAGTLAGFQLEQTARTNPQSRPSPDPNRTGRTSTQHGYS